MPISVVPIAGFLVTEKGLSVGGVESVMQIKSRPGEGVHEDAPSIGYDWLRS